MALREEFEATGNWLFRWRSYLPILLAVPMVFAVRDFAVRPVGEHSRLPWELACLLVSFSGLCLRSLTVGFVPRGTSGRNTREQLAEALNTSGAYSMVRHPLYVANLLMWLGIVGFFAVGWFIALFLTMYWLYYERIMFAEEEFLRKKFGAVFEEWAARTPAFVPNPRKWRPPAMPFCWRTVLRREYTGLFGIAIGFPLLDLAQHLLRDHEARVEPYWIGLAACGSLTYITLMTMKKRTTLLHVEGR